jgi:hypothetical protein
MPYKLRKAPKRDLYWVVTKATGRKHSKEPLPRDRAIDQMRALYAAEGRDLKGEGWLSDVFGLAKKAASTVVQRVTDVTKGKRLDYSPKVRAFLAQHGDKTIDGMRIRRDPIRSMLHTAINAITLGRWAAARKKYAYDKVFHLGLELKLKDGPTTVAEKNEVIYVGPSSPPKDDTETMEIGDPGALTLREMLDKTQRLMGDRYFTYSAFENNCQDFIVAILRANNLWTPARNDFVKQPLEEVIKELPSYTGRLANVATDIAAVADVAIQGRGRRREAAAFLRSLRGGQLLPEEFARLRAQRMATVGVKQKARCPPDRIYDPEKEYAYGDNVCVDGEDGPTYVEIPDPNDPKEYCTIGPPGGPRKRLGAKMKQSECARIQEEGMARWEAARQANMSGTDRFFEGLMKGLTTIGDVAVEGLSMVPGIGKVAANVYKQFAPPGSSYYEPDKATGERIVDTVRGIVGLGKGDTITMSRAQFVKEHRNLIRLLRKYKQADLLKEAAEQSAELKKMTGGGTEDAFLREARRKAKAAGLNWQTLRPSVKSGKKLMITAPDGRVVHFGAKGMGDHIHYKLAGDPKADQHRQRYRARATKIRGDWASDKYSPNSLAIAVLW